MSVRGFIVLTVIENSYKEPRTKKEHGHSLGGFHNQSIFVPCVELNRGSKNINIVTVQANPVEICNMIPQTKHITPRAEQLSIGHVGWNLTQHASKLIAVVCFCKVPDERRFTSPVRNLRKSCKVSKTRTKTFIRHSLSLEEQHTTWITLIGAV